MFLPFLFADFEGSVDDDRVMSSVMFVRAVTTVGLPEWVFEEGAIALGRSIVDK